MRRLSIVTSLFVLVSCVPEERPPNSPTNGQSEPVAGGFGWSSPPAQPPSSKQEVEHEVPPASAVAGVAAAAAESSTDAAESRQTQGVAPGVSVPIVMDAPVRAYSRDEWNHWIDADGDCQDTRVEMLAPASPTPEACKVVSGEWCDPFTATVYRAVKDVHIDHIVPLKEAHESGGWQWDATRRELFANDYENLAVVQASANMSKGAKDPAGWMPPNEGTGWRCWYVNKWIAVKAKYDLAYDEAEAEAVRLLLQECAIHTNLPFGCVDPNPPTVSEDVEPATSDAPHPIHRLHEREGGSGGVRLERDCCRTCNVGKACGDSCISRKKTCHKGRGCACNG